jgi:hypothetical protein
LVHHPWCLAMPPSFGMKRLRMIAILSAVSNYRPRSGLRCVNPANARKIAYSSAMTIILLTEIGNSSNSGSRRTRKIALTIRPNSFILHAAWMDVILSPSPSGRGMGRGRNQNPRNFWYTPRTTPTV